MQNKASYTVKHRFFRFPIITPLAAKIVSAIFYEHALAAILAVSLIHAVKREQSRILAVRAILAVSVARVIWRDSIAKIADTKIIGIDTQ
jgi:hypothetical protein